MNPIDVVVLLLVVLGALAGARAGFLAPVLGLLGAAAGFGLALLLATTLRDELAAIEQPTRALATLIGLVAFVLVGEAIGAAAGATLSRRVRHGVLGPVEALGGAAVGVAHVVFGVWILGGLIFAGAVPSLGPTARTSAAVQIVGERLPSPTTVAGRLLALLDTTDLPPLFAGLEPPPAPPVELPPDAEAQALASSAIGSTTRVSSMGCGPGMSVGSGFFIGPQHALTNAHVVAGGSEVTVTVDGGAQWATVVAFDAQADLALLYVPGVEVAPLTLAQTAPGRGSTGVALGYPGGGDLTVSAAGVSATYELGGPDIYGNGGSPERTVLELHTEIHRGNSGGPLVVEPGVAGGIVFGASRVDPGIGYAIGSNEAVERIGPSVGSTSPVGTGACL
jgi:S1-C subfamily serine protease